MGKQWFAYETDILELILKVGGGQRRMDMGVKVSRE